MIRQLRHEHPRWSRRTGAVLLLALVPGTVQSEPLTLDEAVARALAHSPTVETARALTDAARAEAAGAGRARWPRLGVDLGFHRSNDPVVVFGDLLHQGRFTSDDLGSFDPGTGTFDLSRLNRPDPADDFSAGVSVIQPVWAGGGISSHAAAGDARARAAASRERWTAQETVYRTERAFRAALLAGERLGLLRESLSLARTQSARVESLWAVGLALQSDRQALSAHVQETAARLVAAEAESVEARSLLGWILGLGEPVPGPLAAPAGEGGGPPAAAGIGDRGDVRAAALELRAAEAGVSEARSRYLPGLELLARAAHHSDAFLGEGQGHWFLGARVTWGFEWGSPSGVQAAASRVRAAGHRAREARERAEHEVRVAVTRRNAAVRRLEALEAAVSASRTAYDLVRERHREGLATTLELTEAQNTLTRTSLEAAAARHDLALAGSAVLLASGTLEVPEERP